MTATTTPVDSDTSATFPTPDIAEHSGWDRSGWLMFSIGLLLLGLGGAGIAIGSINHVPWLAIIGGVAVVAALLALTGLTMVAPNEARVLQLLGSSYSGTLRTPGLRWTNPLTTRRAISTRLRNMETGLSKVNDAEGNPIEISAIVVWRVSDTALATFGVDDYEEFVAVQTESAVRHIAGSYPYDAPDRMSLRENADEITAAMSAQVQDRVQAAGVDVIETRINRLAYAPEIAQAMLRRQQAGAVVAARQQIVEGAVGMVGMALQRLDERQVVDLDEERKAAMVSNLLVVLCGDRDTQPVLNTGSLYQ